MRQAVGFDIDGVLYAWHTSLYNYFKKYKDYKGTYRTFWENWRNILLPDDWKDINNLVSLYENRGPIEGSVEFLSKVALRYDIYYITFRPEAAQDATRNFLKKYKFPFSENLIFTDKKADEARRLHLKFFVEDRIDYIEPLNAVTNVILRARVWNKPAWNKYPTAHSFKDIGKFMELIY